MLGYERIYSEKEGPPIDYIIENSFQAHKIIMDTLLDLMRKEGLGADDIFVLVNSVRNP
jgi:hypothetical protein